MTLSVFFFRIFTFASFKPKTSFSRFSSIPTVCSGCFKLSKIWQWVHNNHNCFLFHDILSLVHNLLANALVRVNMYGKFPAQIAILEKCHTLFDYGNFLLWQFSLFYGPKIVKNTFFSVTASQFPTEDLLRSNTFLKNHLDFQRIFPYFVFSKCRRIWLRSDDISGIGWLSRLYSENTQS